jgi:hypothetical protein
MECNDSVIARCEGFCSTGLQYGKINDFALHRALRRRDQTLSFSQRLEPEAHPPLEEIRLRRKIRVEEKRRSLLHIDNLTNENSRV